MRKRPIAISPLEPNDVGAFLPSIDQELTPDLGSIRPERSTLDDELEHLTRLSLDELRLRYRAYSDEAGH